MATQVTLNSGSVDSAGSLALKTNGTTTAVTINASQGVEFNAGTAAAPSITTTGDTNTGIFFPAADTIAFSEGGTEAMRLDSAGNMGLGVTPSAWATTSRGLQWGANSILENNNSAATYIGFNGYRSATGWKYITSSYAQLYGLENDGGYKWYQAASGTAGNAITFTQAMTLDASGNLLVGITSGSNKFMVGDGTRDMCINPNSTLDAIFLGTVTSKPLVFGTGNAERARIDSSGNLLVGTTSLFTANTKLTVKSTAGTAPAADFYSASSGDVGQQMVTIGKYDNNTTTSQVFQRFVINNGGNASGQINANGANAAAFGSWSDSRLKENIVDLPPQLDNIMALRPVEYDYIESEGGGHQIGFVAQEVQTIYPDLVGERTDGMLTLTDLNKNDARLIKAIQELKALVDTQASTITQLQADVAALKGTA